MLRSRVVLFVLGVLSVAVFAGAGSALALPVVTAQMVFSYSGGEQVFVVPAGVTTVDVVAVGARGGTGAGLALPAGAAGGAGAVRSGTLAVVPGQRLYVEVGGVGGNGAWDVGGTGGFNGGGSGASGASWRGGGGGGGASDVRSVPKGVQGSPESRLLIAAGGGGGAGVAFDLAYGGGGGAADQPGANNSFFGAAGGGAGGASAGGAPNGTYESGGPGIPDSGTELGGGGGGGLYGGGGGGSSGAGSGGGGGGGSSYFAPQVFNRSTAGGSDVPFVTISYLAPTANLSATSATFPGTQSQGTVSAPQTVSLTNAGQVPLVITGLVFEGTNPEDFLLGSTDCVSQVAANTTCTLGLRFAPQASGARIATLKIKTSIGDRTINLAGTGGQLPQGPKGDTGDTGATGAQGLPGPAGKDGQLVLVAYQATTTRAKATVRYALTGPADVTLKVKPAKGTATTVATAKGKAGINQISWNRKLKGKKAPKGTYKLTITATAGGKSVSSALSVKLK